MKIRPHNWLCCRVCATALVLGCVPGGLRADSIIFTQPAVPIAVPAREDDSLPKPRRDEMDFSGPVERSFVPQQPQIIQRRQPREYDPDDERNKHPLLRDWKKMPDPLTREFPKSPTQKWLEKNEAKKKEDSLSPVPTFDWRERDEREREREELARQGSLVDRRALQKKEREEGREADPFRLRKDRDREKEKEQRNPFESVGLYAPQTLDRREKATLAEMERRAAEFDELLNPRPATPASVKQRSSLEPVTGFEAPPKPSTTIVTVPPSHQQVVRGPVDPTRAFDERQKKVFNSGFEDPNAKFASPSKQASSKPVAEGVFQTPLLRQPISRDFPTRSF